MAILNQDDFDDLEDGEQVSSDHWDTRDGYASTTVFNSSPNSAKLYDHNGTGSKTIQSTALTSTSSWQSFRICVYIPSTGGAVAGLTIKKGTTSVAIVKFETDGYIYMTKGSAYHKMGTYSKDTWYLVQMINSTTARYYNFYLDGVFQGGGHHIGGTTTDANRLMIQTVGNYSILYVDDFQHGDGSTGTAPDMPDCWVGEVGGITSMAAINEVGIADIAELNDVPSFGV